MKFLTAQLLHFLHDRPSRVNRLALLRFLAILVGLMTIYGVLFHYLMAYEGRQESWITGFYWTLTVMSTLGFGDITFHSDVGRFFSIVVLLSGIIFLLILLPFTFIDTLIEKLNQYEYAYVLLAPDLTEALRLYALGYRVVRGNLDAPETYRQV